MPKNNLEIISLCHKSMCIISILLHLQIALINIIAIVYNLLKELVIVKILNSEFCPCLNPRSITHLAIPTKLYQCLSQTILILLFFSFRMDVAMGGLTHLLQGIMCSDGHR